ncbi:hypothetical protein ACHAQA_009963 [Verticillium albo-atrum]
MVRGRQLDPTLRARIFELRATGYGAKKIHKILPDVPFNTIKTTLRRSKTLTPGPGAGLTPNSSARSLQQPLSDDASPSASPSLDPNLSVAPPLALPPTPTPIRPVPLPQQQQQQQPLPAPQPPQQPQAHPQDIKRQQQTQQQQVTQQLQHHHRGGGGGGGASGSGPLAPTTNPSSDSSQARAARARVSATDLLNEILPAAGSLPGLTATATANPALDLDRLKTDYRAMTDAQRAAADTELDLRKAALVSVRWEARRELEAARRHAQLEQLQKLQQDGIDADTFFARFRELVSPAQAVNGVGVAPGAT